MKISDIRRILATKYQKQEFTMDADNGDRIIEIVGASFVADTDSIFGTPDVNFIKKEIEWYHKLSTNINDIGEKTDIQQKWLDAADQYGNINSNYGELIFSPRYLGQYSEVSYELELNPESRRAVMIYNRPSMCEEYKENGKYDFIPTNAVGYHIRDNRLNATVQMSSIDAVTGYHSDYAWQKHVLAMLHNDLDHTDSRMDQTTSFEVGDITWQAMSLYVHEKDFHLLDEYLNV